MMSKPQTLTAVNLNGATVSSFHDNYQQFCAHIFNYCSERYYFYVNTKLPFYVFQCMSTVYTQNGPSLSMGEQLYWGI